MGRRTNVRERSVESDVVIQCVDKKEFVKDGALQFKNFRINFHKFYSLFSTGLSHLSHDITNFPPAFTEQRRFTFQGTAICIILYIYLVV
jgi:hypothetical protein